MPLPSPKAGRREARRFCRRNALHFLTDAGLLELVVLSITGVAIGAAVNEARPQSCFGVRRDGHVYTAESCCDVRRHGLQGNLQCWGYDEELSEVTSFERCCVEELLGARLLADRPPLIVDLLLDLHPQPQSLWGRAWELCASIASGCRHAEVYFSGLQVSEASGRLKDRSAARSEGVVPESELTTALVDVGAHVKSRYLERLEADPATLLIALEPDRMSCRYHLDYARQTLSASALRRFWLLPAAVGSTLDLSVLHRANHFFDGQCSSLLEFRADAVAWDGCTQQTGIDIVSMIPLSDILHRLPESIVDVELKVDVQGYDLQVVLSAGAELKRVSRLTIEVQDLPPEDPRVRYVGQRSRADIEAALRDHGYEIQHCEPYNEQSAFIKETDCHFVRTPSVGAEGGGPLFGERRVHLVTFADDEPFSTVQRLMDESSMLAGFSSHSLWNLEEVMRRLADGRPNALSDIESGSWLPFNARWWKPFIILEKLYSEEVKVGDWVAYQDSTKYVPQGFDPGHARLLNDTLDGCKHGIGDVLAGVALPQSIQWEWSQRCVQNYCLSRDEWSAVTHADMLRIFCDVLTRLRLCPGDSKDAMLACCVAVGRQPMLQNAWVVLRKGASSIAFVKEWLRWNVNADIMRAMPFADQSLFELVAHNASHRIGLQIVHSAALSNPLLQQDTIGQQDTPTNRLKHLGVALEQLDSAKAQLIPLASVGVAEWHEEAVEPGRWQRSLCLS